MKKKSAVAVRSKMAWMPFLKTMKIKSNCAVGKKQLHINFAGWRGEVFLPSNVAVKE